MFEMLAEFYRWNPGIPLDSWETAEISIFCMLQSYSGKIDFIKKIHLQMQVSIWLACSWWLGLWGLVGPHFVYGAADGTAACDHDAELEELVKTNGTRTRLYMLCHDDESERVAREFAHCKESWIVPVRLNISIFFETVIYRDIFPKHQSELENVDFVITATYKTVHRLKLHEGIYYKQDLAEIKNAIKVARDGNYDFLPFLRSHTGLIDSILYWHGPAFKTAWDGLLQKMGYSIETIRKFDTAKPFYRNIFLSRPRTLMELSNIMQRAMTVVVEEKEVAKLFEQDAKYEGGKEAVALKVFGTKYYHLHPFIFERLPSFFLQAMGANVCIAKEGCQLNY